jgi:putative transposase
LKNLRSLAPRDILKIRRAPQFDARVAENDATLRGTCLAPATISPAREHRNMSRPLRIEFAGAMYHIIARGNARAPIFVDDHDRRLFLFELGRVAERLDWWLWAYCLMGNHYHLVLETARPTLVRGMRDVNGNYSQGFNRRHDRVGHLFQGRYRSILLDLAVPRVLALFDANPDRAPRTFAGAFSTDSPAIDWPAPVRNRGALGNAEFVEDAGARAPSPTPEVARSDRTWKSLVSFQVEAPTRDDAIRAAYASGAYSLRAIGDHFGLHYTTVSQIVHRRRNLAIQDLTP